MSRRILPLIALILLSPLLAGCLLLPGSADVGPPDVPAPASAELADGPASGAGDPAAPDQDPAFEQAVPAVGPAPVTREDPPPDGFPRPTSPPSPPAAVTGPGQEGALAAARYWFLTLNWGTWSNDAGPLRAASSVDCEVCRQLHGQIAERATAGLRVDGGLIRVDDVQLRQVVAEDAVLVDVTVTRQVGEVATAAAPETHPERVEQATFVLGLGYTDGRWVTVAVGEAPA